MVQLTTSRQYEVENRHVQQESNASEKRGDFQCRRHNGINTLSNQEISTSSRIYALCLVERFNGQLPLEKGTYLGPHGGLPAPVGILLTLLSETGSPGSGT